MSRDATAPATNPAPKLGSDVPEAELAALGARHHAELQARLAPLLKRAERYRRLSEQFERSGQYWMTAILLVGAILVWVAMGRRFGWW